MSVCDVCNKELAEKEGYLLTTEQAVSNPAYWKKALARPASIMLARVTSDESAKAQLASQMASQTAPWLVCDDCIGIFDVNRNETRQYALRWYDSHGTFSPPGSGAPSLSKAGSAELGAAAHYSAVLSLTSRRV